MLLPVVPFSKLSHMIGAAVDFVPKLDPVIVTDCPLSMVPLTPLTFGAAYAGKAKAAIKIYINAY